MDVGDVEANSVVVSHPLPIEENKTEKTLEGNEKKFKASHVALLVEMTVLSFGVSLRSFCTHESAGNIRGYSISTCSSSYCDG